MSMDKGPEVEGQGPITQELVGRMDFVPRRQEKPLEALGRGVPCSRGSLWFPLGPRDP